MRILKVWIWLACLVAPSFASSMEFQVRDDLVPRLNQLEYIYPPTSPRDYSDVRPPAFSGSNFAGDNGYDAVFYLSGLIEKGDAERFIKFHTDRRYYSQKIVLNSPGGNFLEALKIGAYLKEQQDPMAGDPYAWEFAVLDGDRCLSACALILAMGGSIEGPRIESGAEVGFHMGILPEKQAQSSANVRDIMNLTYDIVYEYTQLIEDGLLSPLLLRESLKHRTAKSFYFLHAGMRSWQMGFQPVAKPKNAPTINLVGLDQGAIFRICSAWSYASYDKLSASTQRGIEHFGDYAPRLPQAATRMKDIFDTLGTDLITRKLPDAQFDVITCSVSRNKNGLVSVAIFDPNLLGVEVPPPTCKGSRRMQGWCASSPTPTYPLNVPLLADSLGCSGGVFLKKTPTDLQNWTPDWAEMPSTRTGVAKREVNIRPTPGLGDTPTGTLAAGATAKIEDCAITNDRQGVFFRIRSGSQSGWVSARFILEDSGLMYPVTH